MKKWKLLPDAQQTSRNRTAFQGGAYALTITAVVLALLIVLNILVSALTIGGITALCCFPAVFIGRRFGTILNDKAEILGGCILIGLGIKILVSHLSGM